MAKNTYNVVVPLRKSYTVTVGQTGTTFGNALPLTVANLVYTNNNQTLDQASDFAEMVPLLDQPGATGSYAVTVGTLPSFLNLDSSTGRITFSSGTGETNFTFTVTFTANGAYTGTVSFVVSAGTQAVVNTINGYEVQSYIADLTPAQVLDTNTNPITIGVNPDTSRFFSEIVGYNVYLDFGTIPYAGASPGAPLWGVFAEGATTILASMGFLLDESRDNGFVFTTNFNESIDSATAQAFVRSSNLLLGVPPGGNQIVNGDGNVHVEVFWVWADHRGLDNFG